MVLDKRKVESSLKRKGFEKEVDGSHVVFTYRRLNGDLSRISTHVSHGNRPKDLDDYLVAAMARQCKLKKRDFEHLARCPMKQEEYERIVKKHL